MKPLNPYIVLLSAALLPGSGHVWQGLAQRGLMFLFFMIILGWASLNIMPLNASFIARNIGGIFVYGLSVIDAYKIARIRFVEWSHAQNNPGNQ